MIGDVLFYRMHQPSLFDDVITLYEGNHNDFVHVAIQVSETRKVEATYNNGVVMSNLNNARVDVVYQPVKKRGFKLKTGIDWLTKQVGQDYGYGDIVDVLLRYPVIECHYDCSALAAAYLNKIGIIEGEAPSFHLFTPQSLAEALGIQ